MFVYTRDCIFLTSKATKYKQLFGGKNECVKKKLINTSKNDNTV